MHVTQEIVDLNIGRMVKAYTGEDDGATEAEVLANLDTYRSRPKVGFEALIKNTDFCANPQIASALTECATAVGRLDVADLTLSLSEDPHGLLAASIAMAKDAPAAALSDLKGEPENPRNRSRTFNIRIRANLALGDYDAAAAATMWSREMPNSTTPLRLMAKTLSDQGDVRAERWFEQAIKVSDGAASQVIEFAEFLARQGKMDEARKTLCDIGQANQQESRRVTRLLEAI